VSNSKIPGLYRKPVTERIRALVDKGYLPSAQAENLLAGEPLLNIRAADRMAENVIGVFGLPFGVAPNFVVDGKDYVVPMVVEEPSVIAGVSNAAKLFGKHGGFRTEFTESLLIGQIQLIDIEDPDAAINKLAGARDRLLDISGNVHPNLEARGGGVRDIEYYKYRISDNRWTVVLHILVDTGDAMGANLVNSICEALAPAVEEIAGGRVVLRILSNLADRSLIIAKGSVPARNLRLRDFSGEEVRDGIVLADQFAHTDPYRAATHNKGIMNGIDAVAIATGNDWRAIEAGVHAYAARRGRYRSLTKWTVGDDGQLVGELAVPLKVGTVGGSLSANPGAALGLSIAGAASSDELARLMAATGLAQNFAALRALVTHGIQKGHMRLHARSVASSAGVPEEHFEQVVTGLVDSGDIKVWKAGEIARELRSATNPGSESLAGQSVGTAAGKVILLGEHGVVYDRQALAVPIPDAVSARVSERDGQVALAIPAWGMKREWMPGESAGDAADGIVSLIMRTLGVAEQAFDIHVDARIPMAMGLGSSAAFAVAVIRAFDHLLNLGLDDVEVDTLAFQCEELTHGTPSGIDNNLATFGQTVLFSKSGRTKPIDLEEMPPLVVAASGRRRNTRELVAGVRERFEMNRALYSTLFDEMGEISAAGARALLERDYVRLGGLMNVCHGYLNAIEVSSPELEKMISIARSAGAAGAKLTGAGGGGSIVALCPGKVAEVANVLAAAGYQVITLTNTLD
jgi:hydroxymethylglutaryl-CoA reductase